MATLHTLEDWFQAYLAAEGPKEETACLEGIVRLLRPVMKGMIGRRRLGDVEDLEESCLTAALKALHDLKRRPSSPVESPESYLVRVIANECNRTLRSRHPARHRLKNELLDIFHGKRHIQGLALWAGRHGERLCGFRDWQGRPRSPTPLYRLWMSDPAAFHRRFSGKKSPEEMDLAELLSHLFNSLETPVEIDDLVGMIAEVKGLRETSTLSLEALEGDDETPGIPGLLNSKAPFPEEVALDRLESVRFLAWLWKAIEELPVSQRKALLFHLETEELMALTAAADWKAIAYALEVPSDAMPSLLKSLPLPDAEIAALLGVSRQGIINLRKSACSRLSRREKRYRG